MQPFSHTFPKKIYQEDEMHLDNGAKQLIEALVNGADSNFLDFIISENGPKIILKKVQGENSVEVAIQCNRLDTLKVSINASFQQGRLSPETFLEIFEETTKNLKNKKT